MEPPLTSRSRDGRRGVTLAAALLGWMFDGFEMGLFPLVARPALRELLGQADAADIGIWSARIMAAFLLGAAVGGVLFGWLGDRVGRVRALTWSVATYAVFSGLCGFATAPWQLAGLRFLGALGMGGEWALGVALVMEVWPNASRPMLAGLIGAACNVGFLLIACTGLVLAQVVTTLALGLQACGLGAAQVEWLLSADRSGWRLLMLLGAAPAALTFFIRLYVPESERWQAAARSGPKARLAEIFAPGLCRATLFATGLSAITLLGMWGSTQWIPSWADKIARGDPSAKAWAQIATASGSVVGSMLTPFVTVSLSRRWSFFWLCAAALAFCSFTFRTTTTFDARFLALAVGVGALTASFFGLLPLYLPELFPTRLRTTGQGFAYNAGRVFAAAGTLAGGSMLATFDDDYARMASTTCLVYALGLVWIWFCPETRGKALPD